MKTKLFAIKWVLLIIINLSGIQNSFCQIDIETKKYIDLIRKKIFDDYKGMYKAPKGNLKYPFITPGSSQYTDQLWDWDSWLTTIALKQIQLEKGNEKDRLEALEYEKGCILNFLEYGGWNGWIPIVVSPNSKTREELMNERNVFEHNMHKPCLAQHAALIIQNDKGNAEWIREKFYPLQSFVNCYLNHYKHKATGLIYWKTDEAIGVDNDPTVFYRPNASTANVYLNTLMYKEILATAYIAKQLEMKEIADFYEIEASKLSEAIQKNLWDPKDGFYYSVDLNLKEYSSPKVWWELHVGGPRTYDCLLMRIGVWSGFMAMWANIATPQQAKLMVEKNYRDTSTFNAPYGVRTLSKMEKMYDVRASGNPSSWLGPIWINANYLVFKGLVNYGFNEDAKQLAIKTIHLLGKDFEKNGALHEYYLPESGTAALNKGFQNWNYLVLNMAAWLEGKPFVSEF